MIENEKDKLIEVFGRFCDEQKARQAAEEILAGEQILRDNPAPAAGDALKAKIRLRMRHQLAQRQRANRFWMVNKIAAAAAVIIIIFAISIRQQGPGDTTTPTPGVVVTPVFSDTDWEGEEDFEMSLLAAEIDQAETDLISLHYNYAGGGNVTEMIDELETELMEETEFWKG